MRNASRDLAMLATLKGMKRVLRRCAVLRVIDDKRASARLGLTTADSVMDVKGRVVSACSMAPNLFGD